MLLKKPGVFAVNKLWAIILFKVDFNQNNKRLGWECMYKAEELEVVTLEQFGSRKAKAAIDHCLNKRLTFDLIYASLFSIFATYCE